MSGNRGPSGRTVAVLLVLGGVVGVLAGAIFGWQYAVVGLGAGLGPLLGGELGNKKAQEVDKYRDDLIRGKQATPDGQEGSP